MVTTRSRKVSTSDNNKESNKRKKNSRSSNSDLRLPQRDLDDDISEDSFMLDPKRSRKSINLLDPKLTKSDKKKNKDLESLEEEDSLNDFIVPNEESSYNPPGTTSNEGSYNKEQTESTNEEDDEDTDEDELSNEDEDESTNDEEESEYDPDKHQEYEDELNKDKNEEDKRKKISIMFLFGDQGNPFQNGRPVFDLNKLNNRKNDDEVDPSKKRKRTKPKKPVKLIKRTKTNITNPIKTLDDLIALADQYPDKPDLEYAFDITKARALQAPLRELKNMIGLQAMKEQIVNQIKFIISGLKDPKEMFHTVITGSPGCGKTTCGLILSKIYRALGYSNGKFRVVKRSDLVGEYLGHTAAKTQRVIDSIRGGVLFIDEAYSLGNQEGRDSFSKEAIDTLNQNLSMDDKEQPEFICIVAGYKDELDSCFFSMNPGLARRFTVKFDIGTYDHNELQQIFLKKLELSGWSCDPIPDKFFKAHEKDFKNKGADMVSIGQKSKICHTNRVFGYHQEKPRHLTLEDLKNGLKLFLETESKKQDKDEYFHKHIKPTLFI